MGQKESKIALDNHIIRLSVLRDHSLKISVDEMSENGTTLRSYQTHIADFEEPDLSELKRQFGTPRKLYDSLVKTSGIGCCSSSNELLNGVDFIDGRLLFKNLGSSFHLDLDKCYSRDESEDDILINDRISIEDRLQEHRRMNPQREYIKKTESILKESYTTKSQLPIVSSDRLQKAVPSGQQTSDSKISTYKNYREGSVSDAIKSTKHSSQHLTVSSQRKDLKSAQSVMQCQHSVVKTQSGDMINLCKGFLNTDRCRNVEKRLEGLFESSDVESSEVTSIDLIGCGLTDSTANRIVSVGWPHLRMLWLDQNGISSIEPIGPLSASLKGLGVSGNQLGIESAKVLVEREWPVLVFLKISFAATEQTACLEKLIERNLSNMPMLQTLVIVTGKHFAKQLSTQFYRWKLRKKTRRLVFQSRQIADS